MIDEVERFSFRVGPQATALAAILAVLSLGLRDYTITSALVVGSALDIASFAAIVFYSRRIIEKSQLYPALVVAGLFEVRVILKFVLIYLALVFPRVFDIWAMLVGVLIVEAMIVIASVPRMLREGSWPGRKQKPGAVGNP